jgi:predicted permease
MSILVQDVRYAARKLARHPGFTFVAAATLALAIGATTAVFSIVNGVLLKPLPFREPSELVRVTSSGRTGRAAAMSALDFVDYRDQSRSFAGMAAISDGTVNLTTGAEQPARLSASWVGVRFFELLGALPQLGRPFTAADEVKGAARVVILSDELWRNRFRGDRRIVGQTISLDGNAYIVAGVAPPTLNFPPRTDVWIPLKLESWMLDPGNRGAHFLNAIGRLKPGVAIETARRDLLTISERLAAQYPESNATFRGMVQPLTEYIVGDVEKALYTMFGAVAFVLLIACANIANLLLVRAAGRETEIAVRTALGAGRSRIVRQLVTESVLLSVIGAVVGTALAAWVVDGVVAFGPQGLPRLEDIVVDGRVLAFSIGLAIVTGILFGLVPAVHAARGEIGQLLKEGVRGSRGGRAAQQTRALLVVSEMALAVILLVGAGLLIRSFVKLTHVDPGFHTEQLLKFSVSVPQKKYPYDRDRRRFADDVMGKLVSLPGTQSVAVSFDRPMQRMGMYVTFEVDGRPLSRADSRPAAAVHPAGSTYFSTLGVRLLRGRFYTKQEETFAVPPVLVVNESFARKHFPNEDALGKHITLGIDHDTAQSGTSVTTKGEIVGIVADVKQLGLATPPAPDIYVPFGVFPLEEMNFFVRSTADAGALANGVRARMREVDAALPIYEFSTMQQAVAESVSQPRFYMMLLSGFAVLALVLAALGIYGVISYSVSQRTRELGIRIALGATHERVVRLILSQGVALTTAGVAIGLLGAYWLTELIAALLFGVTKADPVTFVGVAAMLLGVAWLASYLPARRAARVDPVIAMRAE